MSLRKLRSRFRLLLPIIDTLIIAGYGGPGSRENIVKSIISGSTAPWRTIGITRKHTGGMFSLQGLLLRITQPKFKKRSLVTSSVGKRSTSGFFIFVILPMDI
jgi:hypothetical protein